MTQEQATTRKKKSKREKKKKFNSVIGALFVLGVGLLLGYILFGGGAVSDSEGEHIISGSKKLSNTTAQKTGDEIEGQIRDIIYIPDDESVVAISFINSQQALDTLTSGEGSLLAEAQIGDYYVVFENRAILYRDSLNKIINYAPIIR